MDALCQAMIVLEDQFANSIKSKSVGLGYGHYTKAAHGGDVFYHYGTHFYVHCEGTQGASQNGALRYGGSIKIKVFKKTPKIGKVKTNNLPNRVAVIKQQMEFCVDKCKVTYVGENLPR